MKKLWLFAVLAAIGCALPASGASATTDWAMGGHDLANTRSQDAEKTIGAANASQLAVKWQLATHGDISATPAVVDGAVYVPDWAGYVYKVNAATGAVIWERKLDDYAGLPAGSVVELYSDHSSVFYDDPVSVEPVVVEDGFSLFEQWGSLQGSWAAIVENPSTQALRYVSLIATLRDANGSIVDVDTGSLSSMAPGSRSAYGSDYLFDVPPTAATVEVAVHASDETATTGSGSLSAGGTTLTSDGEGGWNVAGEITSTLDRDVEFVEVIGVFRDASGVIVGGAVTYVDLVPAQGAVGFTLDTSLGRTDALTVEVFVDHGDAFVD